MDEHEEPPVCYDRYGRMRYHPSYHPRQKTPWTTSDEAYLIAHYVAQGPEHVSLALGRTIQTVMTRAWELRQQGRMAPSPSPRPHSWRTRHD